MASPENPTPSRPSNGRRERSPESSQPNWKEARPYAILAGGSFLAAVAVVGIILLGAGQLNELGLVGSLYYVVLVPLGLCAALCLFGVLRSYARYSGKQYGGVLELGGPIVGFALVVLLAPKPQAEAFDVTVFVEGDSEASSLAVRESGEVWMEVGADRRHEKIDAKGQVVFQQLAPQFRTQKVSVRIEAKGFQTVQPKGLITLTSPLKLQVRRADVELRGVVFGPDTRPLAGARVRVGDVKGEADADGHFLLKLAGDAAAGDIMLEVNAVGFTPYRQSFPVGARPIQVVLTKE